MLYTLITSKGITVQRHVAVNKQRALYEAFPTRGYTILMVAIWRWGVTVKQSNYLCYPIIIKLNHIAQIQTYPYFLYI